MRHLSLYELLALEDGEDLATARDHLKICPQCHQEQDQIRARQNRLRSLPGLRPARDAWPRIHAALLRRKRRRRVALASAGLAAAVAVGIWIPGLLRQPVFSPQGSEELSAWMRRSQDLEERLRAVPEPTMLDVASADELVQLEDQIAFVDRCLGELPGEAAIGEGATALWQARVELLEALLNLRMPALALISR